MRDRRLSDAHRIHQLVHRHWIATAKLHDPLPSIIGQRFCEGDSFGNLLRVRHWPDYIEVYRYVKYCYSWPS